MAKSLLGEGTVCADCCKEFNLPQLPTDSHGICQRHCYQRLIEMGLPEEVAREKAKIATSPDMADTKNRPQ